LRAPATKARRRARAPTISARLAGRVTLAAQPSGEIVASFDGYSVSLGVFSAAVARRAQDLRTGLPLASFTAGRRRSDQETQLLLRRLAAHGLLEFRLGGAPQGDDRVIIEPQVANYWPQIPKLSDADALVLSRFAVMHRRGDDMVLESPRAGASFRISDRKIAALLATLSTPQQVKELCRQDGFPGLELLALLVDCEILLKTRADVPEGDEALWLWEFHDLLFHSRSTEGRHTNPLGGVYAHAGALAPLPAVRPRWPGKRIDLRRYANAPARRTSPFTEILQQRHSTRVFDDRRPITVAELARFLDASARILSRSSHVEDLGDVRPVVTYTARPYPSAGASYALELYLAVDRCEGLRRGFYHYDAGAHALSPIATAPDDLRALLTGAAFAMGAFTPPPVLITIAARFGRVSWKYSALAYALILKDVGVLTQTLYLMATDMELGGCAIGTTDIELFAKMTGIEFHVEGAVGQFALGRPAERQAFE
jgi:SagB-type dehydrogenase family enzyme